MRPLWRIEESLDLTSVDFGKKTGSQGLQDMGLDQLNPWIGLGWDQKVKGWLGLGCGELDVNILLFCSENEIQQSFRLCGSLTYRQSVTITTYVN